MKYRIAFVCALALTLMLSGCSNASEIISIDKNDVEAAVQLTLSDFDFEDGYSKTNEIKIANKKFTYNELLIAKLNCNKADGSNVDFEKFEPCEKSESAVDSVKKTFENSNISWIDEMESPEIAWCAQTRQCEIENLKLSVTVYMLENKTTNEYYVIFDQTDIQ